MARDDSAATPTWRNLDDTVLQIRDAALNPVPDDPNYAFLGVDPGTQVHVVPQTQNPAVVWVGWNTQDPEVMERVDRGATLSLLGVDGPGDLTMYLQSGNFGAPEILWDSTDDKAQPIWVDVNTHTHANWVFSEPGVYLVHVEVSADLIDGTEVSDSRSIRFAVGDAIRTDDAFAAVAATPEPQPGDSGTTTDQKATGDGEEEGGSSTALIAIIVAALVLVAGVAIMVRRSASSRTRAAEITAARGAAGDTPGTGPTTPNTP
jgi:surface-anchored protein